MKFSSRQFVIAAVGFAALAGVSMAQAAMVEPRDVVISDGVVSVSLTGKAGDPAAGAEVFKGRRLGNCLACHANADMADQQFHGEVGPPLDGVAERWSPEELRAIIVDSKAVFGDHTIMPSFYKVISDDPAKRVNKKFKDKTVLEAQQVEDVIAYLMTLK